MPADAVFAALAARAEAGGDATLSDDVWRAMGWFERDCRRYWFRPDNTVCWGPRPDLCTSIDAQAALPGRLIAVQWDDNRNCRVVTEAANGTRWYSVAPSEPLARLAALLRAMAAKDPADDR